MENIAETYGDRYGVSFKEARNLYKWAEDLCGEGREVLEAVFMQCADFEAGNFRFIHRDSIDQIQQDELAGDEYILGCFNADFLAGVTGWPQELIEAAQSAEGYEALGKTLISEGYLEAIQEGYAAADGYGHHFAHYDHQEHERGEWYAFRTN